jgi:cell division protein FtsQ
VLGVAQVEVTGTARTAPDAVVAAAHVRPGTPLARVGVDAVAGRVRAALPPVADVRVRRVWPRTLRLQVTERQPAAGVARADGVVLLSSDGVAFATEPALPPGVPGLELAAPGRDDPATRAALAVLTELPPGLRRQVAVVRATTGSDVQLVLADQRTVVWGRSGAAPEKAATLTALLRLPGTFFDVSAPGVAVRR